MTGAMNRLRTVVGRSGGREAGLGLPELLVTMVLVSVLTLAVVQLVSSLGQTFTRDRSSTDSTNIAAVGMNEITRVVRSGTEVRQIGGMAPVVLAADAEMLVLHTYLDTDSTAPEPLKVRFRVTSDRDLVEDRWLATSTGSGTWSFPATTTTPATSRVISRKITPSEPVFEYYDSYERDAVPMVIAPGGLTVTQRAAVVRIGVTLTVQADLTDRANPVQLTNIVGIPNLGVNVLGAATP